MDEEVILNEGEQADEEADEEESEGSASSQKKLSVHSRTKAKR